MCKMKITGTGDLLITPSPDSSKHDFDFLEGKWNIHNRKLRERLAGSNDWEEFEATGEMQIILNGTGNTDSFIANTDDGPFEGRTLRLFNPLTKLWSIYWADSRNATLDTPVVGSFKKNTGYFYCKDVFNDQPVLVMFQWDKTIPDQPVWSQAFSADQGKSWEWNWYMYMTRR